MADTSLTHYVYAFTRRAPDGTQQAACGAWVTPEAFSTEPLCPACMAKLAEDDAEAEQVEALRGQRVAPVHAVDPNFDPTGGRERRSR